MTIPRQKIIIALIPFLLTTIAIIVFLIFFYWGDVTFSGNSPFVIQYNGVEYKDDQGIVRIRSRAGNQTFLAMKDQYQSQTIEQEISWQTANNYPLHFVYSAKVAEPVNFTPSISYVNPVAVSDNQLSDIVAATEKQKIALPAGINTVVWNRLGTQACLLHTGSGSIQNQLLTRSESSFSAEELDNQIFDCQSGQAGINTIGIDNQVLKIGNRSLDLHKFISWQVTTSLYSNEVFVTAQHTDNTKKTVIYWNLDTDTHEEWGTWDVQASIRVIGSQTVAIPLLNETLIISNNKQIFTLPSSVAVASIVFNAQEGTMYYIDIDRELSFKNIFQTTQPPKQIMQYVAGSDKPTSIKTLNDDQVLLSARLSPDQTEGWYLFEKPTSSLLRIKLMPST